MRMLILISAVLVQACWCYGFPNPSDGVGAFAYQDSTGNRYGGTYGLRGGQVVDVKGDYPPPAFQPQAFQDLDDFFPEYFRNFEYLIQEAFNSDFMNQDLAYTAAHKAFDITSNHVGYMPNFDFRFPPFGGFPNFMRQPGGAFAFDMNSPNSAYASAVAGPGFSHHVDMINPENPNNPNVNVMKTHSRGGGDGRYSVSSSSYSSSSNVNGQVKNQRGAETTVDNNGVRTHYKVES